jgi:S-adenosylmethionine hydrolase
VVPAVISLLTDFGDADYYVGAVKGTLARLAPGAAILDISHEVPPGNVTAGAFLLAAAAPAFPAGSVHLAVVDPGVGSERKILAARWRGSWLVAPDNGLLSGFFPEAEARSVERNDLFLSGPGATFHGRDRFAPVAGYLARGESWQELGPRLERPVVLSAPPPTRDARGLTGRVVHVDRFGNLVTDLPAGWLEDRPFVLEIAGHRAERLVGHFQQLGDGEAGILPGSLGTLEVVMNRESVAARWSLAAGATVRVFFR